MAARKLTDQMLFLAVGHFNGPWSNEGKQWERARIGAQAWACQMRNCEEHPRAFNFPNANCESLTEAVGSLERIVSEEGYVKSRSRRRRAALSRSQGSDVPPETQAKPGSNSVSSFDLEGLHWSTEGRHSVTSVARS